MNHAINHVLHANMGEMGFKIIVLHVMWIIDSILKIKIQAIVLLIVFIIIIYLMANINVQAYHNVQMKVIFLLEIKESVYKVVQKTKSININIMVNVMKIVLMIQ